MSKRKHSGFELPPPTRSYCNVCSGNWNRRKFIRLYKEFDDLNPSRVRPKNGDKKMKKSLNEAQKTILFRHYFSKDGLTVLCKNHVKEFAHIGNNVYQNLMTLAKQPADYEPPIYDQPDPLVKPKKNSHASNKKSVESLTVLKKWLKSKTHPLPDKAPIRIFFSDIPSYRALYKLFKKDHPKGTAHYFSWSTWNYYRRSHFPWVKVWFLPCIVHSRLNLR